MRNLFLAAVCGIILVQAPSCQKGGAMKTPGGHLFTNHTNGAGPKITYGNLVTISVNTWLKDSLVSSTSRDFGGPRELMLPASKEQMPAKVPAVYEALLMMTNGDSATVLQTIDSVFVKQLPPTLADAKDIRYELKVVSVLDSTGVALKRQEMEAKAAEVSKLGPSVLAELQSMINDFKSKKLGDRLKKTESGLEYVILEQGTGAPIKAGEKVNTNYYGALIKTGKDFDNSYNRGGAVPFAVGQLIPGFNEGMLLCNHGSKAVFFIPWKLGYGEQGAGGLIGPKEDLAFYVHFE